MAGASDNNKRNVIITDVENGDYRGALMVIDICNGNE